MRTTILKRAWRAFGQAHFIPQSRGVIVMVALLLAAASLFASPVVNTLGGGNPNVKPKYLGYEDGITLSQALFHTPCGLALDSTGQYLFVADRDNNAIRFLDLVAGYTWTFDVAYTNLINKPIAVAVDTYDYVYVLNRGNTNNGSVVTFDNWGDAVATNAVKLTNAAGMAMDYTGNIYITVQNNKLIRIAAGTTNRTTIATIPNAGTSLQGIVVKQNGLIAACDSGRNGIYLINPATGVVTTNAGFHGTGDFTTNGNNIASSTTAKFNQPMCVVEAGDGTLIVTDNGNNRVKAVLTSGVVTNLYGVTSKYWGGTYPGWYDGTVSVPDSVVPNVQSRLPFGVVIASDGSFYTTEDYYHLIRHVTGAGLLPPPPPPPGVPTGLTATAGYGQVLLTWVASPGATNYNIKRSLSSVGPYTTIASTAGTITSYTDTNVIDGTTNYYVVSALNTGGESANSGQASATPLFSPAPTILLPVTNYNFGPVILTWTTSAGATSYNVKRSTSTGTETTIANTASTSYNDSSAQPGTTYFYVVSAVNGGGEGTNSVEVSYTPPYPPPPAPRIGWFDYEPNPLYPIYLITVLHPFSTYIANNDLNLAIDPTTNGVGVATYYIATNGPQPVLAVPSSANGSTPPAYHDGMYPGPLSLVTNYITQMPDLVIKAVNVGPGGSSPIVTAEILYQVGNPNIIGANAAQFQVNDVTTNVTLWYTIDGTVPTNTSTPPSTSIGPIVITNGTPVTLSIAMSTGSNILFQAQAFRPGYSPSGIASQTFFPANYVPNTISFGFASGEASSDFVASPGQFFYAPVTLMPLSGTEIYSLQFNLTVTNISPAPPITPGAFDFVSMLRKPDPDNPGYFLTIPTYMFAGWYTNPIPPGQLVYYEGTNFVNLETTDLPLNLLGVGWLERYTKTNLYVTLSQDLIAYSQAHDTLFLQSAGQVILGGYAFWVPTNAAPGQTYQIQIGRPSATSDGVGAPGSSVFIYAPTNGSLTNGAINSTKIVTMGQLKYIVGNVYPFRWFNAGDFGNTNLQNADVQQVFNSAIYGLNSPPPGSDFFDAMDSCGNIGTLDGQTGYYTNNNVYPYIFPYSITNYINTYDINTNLLATTNNVLNFIEYIYFDTTSFSAISTITSIFPNSTNVTLVTTTYDFPNPPYVPNLFDGSDQNINQIAFGDGMLDVCDVYVTYRRSLDPSLTWFRRFWANGVRVAETTTNLFISGATVSQSSSAVSKIARPAMPSASSTSSPTNQPKVIFIAGDYQTTAGSTIQIPITASIFGNYPLRVLMLNLTVVPIDGSPALTTPVQFTPNPALGTPYMTDSIGNDNYSAVWLDSTITGLTGNASIGTLTVTIPTNATSLSAYGVHFDHASASPNGIASFPKQAATGLITFNSRTNSSWGDGIPDSWRLRYFLTLNNLLSATNADADGDGVNNLQEYLAGTDPTDPTSFFKKIGTDQGAAQQTQDCVISWPSAIGKQYVIQRSPSLSTPLWTSIATNSGNGTIMDFHDTSGGGVRFYRVFVQ
ncbi:MAG: hypothetical protein ABSH15_08070 [Verrucomicrobiota bacterium]|jgi:hypothetical protein